MINQFIEKDLKKNCKYSKKFKLSDFIGSTFGLFFVLDSIIRIKKGTNGMAIAELFVGSSMILVHAIKFFYAKQLGRK